MKDGLETEERVHGAGVDELLELGATVLDEIALETGVALHEGHDGVAGELGDVAELDLAGVLAELLLQDRAELLELVVPSVDIENALSVLGESRLKT